MKFMMMVIGNEANWRGFTEEQRAGDLRSPA